MFYQQSIHSPNIYQGPSICQTLLEAGDTSVNKLKKSLHLQNLTLSWDEQFLDLFNNSFLFISIDFLLYLSTLYYLDERRFLKILVYLINRIPLVAM